MSENIHTSVHKASRYSPLLRAIKRGIESIASSTFVPITNLPMSYSTTKRSSSFGNNHMNRYALPSKSVNQSPKSTSNMWDFIKPILVLIVASIVSKPLLHNTFSHAADANEHIISQLLPHRHNGQNGRDIEGPERNVWEGEGKRKRSCGHRSGGVVEYKW